MATELGELGNLYLTKGAASGNEIVKVLETTGQLMQGKAGAKLVSPQQWVGFPVIIVGRDPADDSFFMSEQSIFKIDKTKIAKSPEAIAVMFNGPLQRIMLNIFDAFSNTNIKSIYTLSVLFADNKKNTTRDGESFISFQPAAVNYTVKTESPLGGTIAKATIGVAILNEMRGPNLNNLNQFKAIEIPNLGTDRIWQTPGVYTDITGLVAMNMVEKANYNKALKQLDDDLKATRPAFNHLRSGKKYKVEEEIKKYFDSTYRVGQKIDPALNYNQFYSYASAQIFGTDVKNNLRMLAIVGVLSEDPKAFGKYIACYLQIKYCLSIIMNKFKAISQARVFQNRGSYYQIEDKFQFVGVNTGKSVRLVNEIKFKGVDISLPKRWDK